MTAVDTFGVCGATIRTVSGLYVDLLNPDPATITISDIAMALSRICRYGGHVPEFYSVADHSIYCVKMAVHDGVVDKSLLRTILLHDAAEAYLGDIVKPLKNLLPGYAELERGFERVIEQKFAVDFAAHREQWQFYDRTALKTEKVTFFPEDTQDWTGFESYRTHELKPRRAFSLYLARTTIERLCAMLSVGEPLLTSKEAFVIANTYSG